MRSKPKNETTRGKELKISMAKQMLRRLSIVLAQVKACNTFENLLNEIYQLMFLCIQRKKLLKKYKTT